MKTKSDTVKNVCKVVMLPVFVYLLFFICSGGAFGKPGESYYEPEANAGPYANFIRNVFEHVV